MLIGYTDRYSARAGETLEVKISSSFRTDYRADLVRLYSADPNPQGPGMDARPIPAAFEGNYRSVEKSARPGSYALIALAGLGDIRDDTISIRFQPRLDEDRSQTLLALRTADGRVLCVSIEVGSPTVGFDGTSASLACRLELGIWYELRLGLTASDVRLACYAVITGERIAHVSVARPDEDGAFAELSLAARRRENDAPVMAHFFNGRLENPAITRGLHLPDALAPVAADDGSILASWDFALDIPTDRIRDRGPRSLDGKLHNLPARAVRGSRWTGTEMCWQHAPDEYAAIHFHEDDLHDCGWETDFRVDIPLDLESGVYGVRLSCEGTQDIIPFFVRPACGAKIAKAAILFSTLTYQAYCNYPRTNYGPAYVARRDAWGSYPHHPAQYPEFGRSLYDVHPDDSGVMFSSALRPQLLMRPGFFAYLDDKGSGLRHFSADMHLIAWCAAKGIEVDVVTDHDLDAEGVAVLAGYDLVLTVSHPEYHTGRSLDAIGDFIEGGGNFGYLGGNGFFWRVATSEAFPGAIEIRRGESGVRMWQAETGEFYHAFDGQYGGLWLKNDRPPQALVGVGMSAHGPFDASFYRRTAASRAPAFAWLFDGIEEEIIGDFGFSGGGAAGFELDCIDPSLGTPAETVVLASSEAHSSEYNCVPEKIWNPDVHTREWQAQQIRADLCIVPQKAGNFVFSTGSIMFCGSLPANGFDNSISRLLENLVRRCL
ncbi:putative N,N-dimethylformamidase large subunit [Mesorhizobium sp. SOD10]|nr:putative N,N-dimethylformamidase large subunit [Mesorhizobium sp. SOD10]